MKHNPFPKPPRRVALASSVVALAIGCHAPPPSPDVRPSIAAMTGLDDVIAYRTRGEPIDVGEEPASVLTVERAVRSALAHDPDVQVGLARLHAALADARQARLLPNPLLSVVFRFPDGGGRAEVEAGLSADLLTLLRAPRRVGAADHRLRAAGAEVLVAALDAVAAVEERLVTLQAAIAEANALDGRQRLLGRLLEVARARVEAGEAARLDVLVLDAERVGLEAEGIELEARQARERIALARLLGRPSSATAWTVPPWPDERVADERVAVAPERALIGAALAHRPEVAAVRWELAALGDEAALARASWLDGGGVGVEAERDDGWAIGPAASLSLPVFDWGQARRARANADVVAARHRFTRVGRQVVEEVRQAAAALASSTALLVKVRDELLPLTRQRQEQAEAQYRAGEADLVALLQAEQQLLAARSKLVGARRDVALARSRLRRAVGGHDAAATATSGPAAPAAHE